MKECYETNADIYMSSLQTKSISVSPGLQSLATLPFNILARNLLPRFSRPPILCHNDESSHAALKRRHCQSHKGTDALVSIPLLPIGSTVMVQHSEGNHRCLKQQMGMDQKTTIGDVTRSE